MLAALSGKVENIIPTRLHVYVLIKNANWVVHT